MKLEVEGKEISTEAIVEFLEEVEGEIFRRIRFSPEFRERLIQVVFAALCWDIEAKLRVSQEAPFRSFLSELKAAIIKKFDIPQRNLIGLKLGREDLQAEDFYESGLAERLRETITRVLEEVNCPVIHLSPAQRRDLENIIFEETGCRISLIYEAI